MLDRAKTVGWRTLLAVPFIVIAVAVIGLGVLVLATTSTESWILVLTVIIGVFLTGQLQLQIGKAPIYPTAGVTILMLTLQPIHEHPLLGVSVWAAGVLIFQLARLRNLFDALYVTGFSSIAALGFVSIDEGLRALGVWHFVSLLVAAVVYYLLILAGTLMKQWGSSLADARASYAAIRPARVGYVALLVATTAYVMNLVDAYWIPWMEQSAGSSHTPFVLLLAAALCYALAQRSRYKNIERQLRAVVEAAIELPRDVGGDFIAALQERARTILRVRSVETRERAAGAGEIGAVLSFEAEDTRYLIASDKVGGVPFSWEDERALTALAGMASETVRQQSEVAVLELRANSDPLTGLPNYSAFQRALSDANEQRSYHPGIAVLFIDIDQFKAFNDTQGHQAGDQYLCGIAERLAATATGNDLVARVGGDEFVVILTDLDSLEQAADSAELLLAAMSEPLMIQGQEVRPVVSAGLAYSSNREPDASTLVEDADRTMLLVKRSRPAGVTAAQSTMRISSHRSSRTNAIVARAIENERLTLAFQPIVDVTNGTIWAFEALLRYIDPEIGPISPPSLVARAKRLGLMNELTRQVVTKALDAAEQIRTIEPSISYMTVNLELYQISEMELGDFLVEQSDAHPEVTLCVELNERSLRYASDELRHDAVRLQRAGVILALDDYGSDDSSAGSLVHFPMDVLKIDKSLIDDLGDVRQREVVRALQTFGDSLGSKVVVEGIEQSEMAERITELGVRHAQGYFYGRPVPLNLTIDRLREWGTAAVLS